VTLEKVRGMCHLLHHSIVARRFRLLDSFFTLSKCSFLLLIEFALSHKMESTQKAVANINTLASRVQTSYSQISTDLVLDINCYSSNTFDSSLDADMKRGLITGKLCVPCEDPRSVASAAQKSQTKKTRNSESEAPKQKHSASLLSTCSISFSGLLDGRRTSSFLDDILFGNGARVGGGYRQPNITYVDLLDNPKIVSQSTDRSQDEVFVFSSAAVVPSSDSSSRKGGSSAVHGVEGTDDMMIFRIKGVLHINGEEYLQILQGVFDVFEVKPSTFLVGSKEDLSKGLNRVVVIGRNIDREQIEEGFLSCLL
jgi:G3E family GTPase